VGICRLVLAEEGTVLGMLCSELLVVNTESAERRSFRSLNNEGAFFCDD
jgi:hypothetical protein